MLEDAMCPALVEGLDSIAKSSITDPRRRRMKGGPFQNPSA